jgi:nitrogen fixation/metabolism regulation signal transduction histidine kinase
MRALPVLVVALLLASLLLMSDATEGSARFGELYSVLLVINVLALLTMAVLIGWNLVRLLRQVAQRRPGARLTVRMVAVFVVLAVTPVLVVYYFSLQFLHRGIDSWFDVRVERAMDDALELSRAALGERMSELLSQTKRLANELSVVEDERLPSQIEDARLLSGASEVTVLGQNGAIVASSNIDPTSIVPARPSETMLMQLRQSGDYIGLDPVGKSGLQVRVVVHLPPDTPSAEPRILQGLFPITARLNTLAESVETQYAAYRELAYLRRPLKISFTLTLSLVLLLSLFTAVWAAFYSARRMVAPLRDLALGTQAVAAGNYETQLATQAVRDEVGFLVESFNDMTRRLASARDETRHSQQQLEAQRRYLEAVLARLSTGVLTLDAERRVFTANTAAAQILGVELLQHAGSTLAALADAYPHLQPFADTVVLASSGRPSREAAMGDWRAEVTVFGATGRQVLVCSGASLAGVDEGREGHVLVFDDVTTLIQAQRDAAWSEVARRLAHEIKNPLTPIQLSAERLRHKYMGQLESGERDTFDRLTRTIVQQVDAMKSMVNAFSDYARSPKMKLQRVDLNDLIADVVELYRTDRGDRRVKTELEPGLPALDADPDRLRQILHNLLKNALEAQGREEGGSAHVQVQTRHADGAGDGDGVIELIVADRGPGYPKKILDSVFDPYVTTKPKGSGLGLAIVKKIAEEHGGSVRAQNAPEGGARVLIRLPVASAQTVPQGQPGERRTAV